MTKWTCFVSKVGHDISRLHVKNLQTCKQLLLQQETSVQMLREKGLQVTRSFSEGSVEDCRASRFRWGQPSPTATIGNLELMPDSDTAVNNHGGLMLRKHCSELCFLVLEIVPLCDLRVDQWETSDGGLKLDLLAMWGSSWCISHLPSAVTLPCYLQMWWL